MNNALLNNAFRMHGLMLPALLVASGLAGCDRDSTAPAATGEAGDVASLPRPEAGTGSVTGFDGASPAPEAPADLAENDLPEDPDSAVAHAGETGAADGEGTGTAALDGGDIQVEAPGLSPPVAPAPSPAEPGAAEAAAVVRNYYAAINAGQYPRAYALWSDGGAASGQSAQQFADGFGNTARVTASTGQPGRVEGAAGSRYVTVPVAVEAIQDDGTIRHYDGTYTLRRAVVDGATAEQRQWRISDADLRQVE